MKQYKWFAAGMGALVALTIVGSIFNFSSASADEGLDNGFSSAVIEDGVFQDEGTDEGTDEGNGRGRRGNRNNGGEFLADELGITEEELSAANEAARDAATDETTREERAELLAAELGITVEALQTAQDAARNAAVAEAVANGDITQEQVDTKEAQQAFKAIFDKKAATADALGLTVEELEAAKEDGTSKEELLEDAGITKAEFKEAVEEAEVEALDEAVDNGDITEAQADLIENAPERPQRGERGNGEGGRGQGNGGRGNGGQGNRGGDGNG